jgi:hypothetical protein
MLDMNQEPHSEARNKRTVVRFFFIMALIVAGCCPICMPLGMLFSEELMGTISVTLFRYPNAELIWSGYGAWGGDYGTKAYIMWTSDSVEVVSKTISPLVRVKIIDASTSFANQLWICQWVGFFYSRPDSGCAIAKDQIPNYGTILEYTHGYWAG